MELIKRKREGVKFLKKTMPLFGFEDEPRNFEGIEIHDFEIWRKELKDGSLVNVEYWESYSDNFHYTLKEYRKRGDFATLKKRFNEEDLKNFLKNFLKNKNYM